MTKCVAYLALLRLLGVQVKLDSTVRLKKKKKKGKTFLLHVVMQVVLRWLTCPMFPNATPNELWRDVPASPKG